MRFQVARFRAQYPDADEDGFVDPVDLFPDDSAEWWDADGDGTGDNADADDDNDGVVDTDDAFPFDGSESADTDGDGLGDNADAFPLDPGETSDADGDGVGDNSDVFPTIRWNGSIPIATAWATTATNCPGILPRPSIPM